VTTRRDWLIALSSSAIAGPLTCFAQSSRSKIVRVGLLESASNYAKGRQALIVGLRELGYVEGKNLIIESRAAAGKYDRLPELSAELARMKVDVIVASTAPAIRALQQATATIPIVMVRNADPVGSGFVASLSRPGRNVTGLSNINAEVTTKYVELLRAAVPKLSQVTVLMNTGNRNHPAFLKRIQSTEKTNGVKISFVQAISESEIQSALGVMKQQRPGALIVLPDGLFFDQAPRISELALQQRLPTMFWDREAVESGALMSYGQNVAEHYYRAATYVDKILRGANQGDLPVEQSTKFELVINLKTAKAIGLAIPQDLLLRADKVIQ